MIMSIPFAYYRRGAFDFFFMKYMIVAVFFILFYKIVDNERNIKYILWTACLGNSIYLLCAVFQGEVIAGRLRFGQMLDPNDLAFFAVSFIPLNFLFISKNETFWKRIVSPVNIAVGILVVLLSGSRGGFLALVIVVIMLFFTRAQIIRKSYKIAVFVITLIALIYGGATIDYSRLETMTQIGGDYNVWDETGRLEVWMNGMRFMLSDPLTGVGVSCFGEAIGQDRAKRGLQEMWQAPHNSLVQIGAETGIIGLVIFVLININVFKICGRVRNISGKQELAIIGTIIQIGFVGHFTASMFLSQAYSGIWVLFVALSATILEMGRTRNNQQHSKNIETEKRYL